MKLEQELLQDSLTVFVKIVKRFSKFLDLFKKKSITDFL